MYHRLVSRTSIVMAFALLAWTGGCDTLGGSNGGGGNTEGDTQYECGTRTVTSIPPAGYVQYLATVTLAADPTDSNLGKVVLQAAMCQDQFSAQAQPAYYQIDEDGTILFAISLMQQGTDKVYWKQPVSNERLALRDGCLVSELEQTNQNDNPTNPNDLPTGPCPLGQFAIDQHGIMTQTPESPYICVQVVATSACQDCWFENGVWHQEIVTQGYYVAMGSLTGVNVYGWAAVCDHTNPNQTVTINDGDRVDFTWTYVFEYQVSQTPEEMGYTQIVYTP